MSYALPEKALTRLKEVLPLSAAGVGEDPRLLRFIRDWALDPEYGGLPDQSGRSFARWLHDYWNDWAEEPEVTVEQVLEGAVADWCGGRSF